MCKVIILAASIILYTAMFSGCGKEDNPESNGQITPECYGFLEIYYQFDSPTGGYSLERNCGFIAHQTASVGWYNIPPPGNNMGCEKSVLLFFSELDTSLSIENAAFKFYMTDSGFIANGCSLMLNGIAHDFDNFPSYDSIIYDTLNYVFSAITSGYVELDITEYMRSCIIKGFVTFIIKPQKHTGESNSYGTLISLRKNGDQPQLILNSR